MLKIPGETSHKPIGLIGNKSVTWSDTKEHSREAESLKTNEGLITRITQE